MKIWDIGEIASSTGIRPSALRYYEDIGLITSVSRHGLRRQFGPETPLILALINMGQMAGFSLKELAAIFGKSGARTVDRAALRGKANDIDKQIRKLNTLRKALRHVAECRAPSHLECPKFQRLMRMAGKRGPAQPARP